MSYWLRFAIVSKKKLETGGVVPPEQMLDLPSDSTSFVAALHPLYNELEPVRGTKTPDTFRLEDEESLEGMWCDQYGPLHYYTPAEVLEALERSLPFYTPSEDDQAMFDTIKALPEDKVLVKILIF